jgi:hypothetical protein
VSSATSKQSRYSARLIKVSKVPRRLLELRQLRCPLVRFYHVIETAPGSQNHTPGFDKSGGTRDAHDKCINSAEGMAMVSWAILIGQATADLVREEFEDDKRQRQLATDV